MREPTVQLTGEHTPEVVDDPRLTPVRLRRDLVAGDYHDRALARDVAAGRLAKPRRGAYVDGPTWRSLDRDGQHEVRSRAVLLQAKTELVVSHASAVPFHDGPTWGLPLDDVHVTRTDEKTGRDEAGVHQHVGVIASGDVVERRGVAVMSPERTALEVTAQVKAEAALVVMNDFLHRKPTTPEAIRLRYDQGFTRWPRTLASDLVIRLADPRIESVGESRFFYLCYREGLPAPEPQFKVFDRSGALFALLDFAWPELGAFAEFDGKVKYQKPFKQGRDRGEVVFKEKRREDRVRELTGFRGLRIVWDDLRRPHHTAMRVRRLLTPATSSTG